MSYATFVGFAWRYYLTNIVYYYLFMHRLFYRIRIGLK